MNLDKVSSKGKKTYQLPSGRKIKDEKEIFITSPVKILHPNDLILLPIVQGGQIYQINAAGGTGSYNIESADSYVASVGNNRFVKSEREGESVIKVSDVSNPGNYDEINIQVTQIKELTWFQRRVEAKSNGEMA
jgi:hypothetical protein